jgi:glucosamine--fructose-6-phosphate aminotransferase (isomerizing)
LCNKKDHVEFFNEDGIKINKKVLELSYEQEKYDKGDFKHFMAKEIEEQPKLLKTGIKEYVDKQIMISIFIIFLGK